MHEHHHHHGSQKNILAAFLLNIFFSVFELVGGLFMHSYAIMSDALHDFADAFSIGVSYFLERKSHKKADKKHTFGYARYSTLGALIMTMILLLGSGAIIVGAIQHIINPSEVNYDGMLIFAVIGILVNGAAVFVTREKESVNHRAVNLHMLEDVLGWIAVLIGATVIKFTGWVILDPIMSLGVAIFLIINAWGNLKPIAEVFLDKAPSGLSVDKIRKKVCRIDGVEDVHHLHVWAADEETVCATMHVVATLEDFALVKKNIRAELEKQGINHAVLELETDGEDCEHREHERHHD